MERQGQGTSGRAMHRASRHLASEKRRAPVARYEDATERESVLPEPGQEASDEERDAYALQRAFVRQQSSYIKDLLSLTLPSGFPDERLMQRPVHQI